MEDGEDVGEEQALDAATPALSPEEILGRLRSLVIQVSPAGEIIAAHGPGDGIAGYAPGELVGRSVFDLVAPEGHDVLTEIFVARAEETAIVDRPLPFPVVLMSANGQRETFDALPNVVADGERRGWVVQLTPQRLHSASVDLIDAVVNGEPLESVARSIVSREQVGEQPQDFLRTIVVMDAGTSSAHVVSSDADSKLVEAVRSAFAVPDHPFLYGYNDGRVHTAELAELGEQARNTAERAGFEALHIGVASDGGSVKWCVLWFVIDARVATLQLNADLPRRAMLRIVKYALERRRAEELLRAAAETDPLTGVGNRALFDAALDGVAGSRRVGVIYTDLDGFKAVNDTYGHAVGDEVLMIVARRMSKISRSVDVLARVGGDEFALLVPDADPALLHEIAERLAEAITRPMMIDGHIIEIGASSGVAMSSSAAGDPHELVRTADLSMLEAKRSSRRGPSGPSWWPEGVEDPNELSG